MDLDPLHLAPGPCGPRISLYLCEVADQSRLASHLALTFLCHLDHFDRADLLDRGPMPYHLVRHLGQSIDPRVRARDSHGSTNMNRHQAPDAFGDPVIVNGVYRLPCDDPGRDPLAGRLLMTMIDQN